MDAELRLAEGRRLLSPAELLSARTRDHKVPQRSHGQKDFLPNGSQEQEERLRQCREEHWQLLEEERVERLGSLVAAEWKPQEGIVELKTPAGKFWHTMGFAEHGKQCLHPEEALYLLECGSIQLFYRGLPMSVQEAYENLLSQKTVSLLKYQVFSHLKRLGYIVLRFHPSSVPTPYERQLNLDSHCQGTERSRSKRRRSSSPRLSQDKKPKDTEKSQECRESPQKTRRYHESSKHPTSDDSSKESTNGSDPKTAVVEPAPSCSVPREAPARAQDDKKRCSKTFRGDRSNVGPSRWDYTTITFPNMGADCPQTLLAEPDKRLLPENITAREVDATRWRRKLNQKHERLTRKEREQLKWESRYKSSVNEDREVRLCSTWQEYKALLKERRRWEERNRPTHLWEQAVTPLVKPDQELSTASVLQQISVFQPSHILDEASLLQNDTRHMKIDFDVYQADVASSFKKNDPGKPYARMCVRSFDEPIPSLRAVKQLACQSGDVTVVFALVDNGDISFYSFKEFKLPVDVHP
ncbi:tRNA-splicing endonuclease subunit Sen54 isoform X1 [Podarcis raffonei]|uniref:tRNA-splicing endonuclease subunit Sen54 isoform X1 n=1 Tax=Podarcis raffonei TaxID=65483 RepID=UPI00232914C7|nr:tRNA-splicing endonuclease subunit Sen54 isoform X1 [Podarcis raffonei]XP_053231872.1 tRNA-splicing endonuclease subunit Sen54 isoform X1 [Podarcis raffonei]XP_053231873.1 tRNA-splicing endonuclease subunit Sen54 isoform X1 [Podarcis raffonei]